MWEVRLKENPKGSKNAEIPPQVFIGDRFNINIAFCPKLVVHIQQE